MKMMIYRIAVAVVLGAMLIPASAHAQLLDEAIATSIGGATEIGSAARGPVSPDAIKNNLTAQGYTNIAPSTTEPGKYTATAPGGIGVLLTVDNSTGKVISAIPQQLP